MVDPDRRCPLPPPTVATSVTFRPVVTDHCPACGSKRMVERRPVETRRPGPRGAGRGTRKPCENEWHIPKGGVGG